jgi:ATP-dependent Clp protease adaptor protein ClpS
MLLGSPCTGASVRRAGRRHRDGLELTRRSEASGTTISRENGRVTSAPGVTIAPERVRRPDVEEDTLVDTPWVAIVWNDPINLMSYVTYVFQKLFGYSREKASKLMYDVHYKGKAVVSTGSREQMEHDVSRLHAHGLWATLQQQ